MSPTSGTNRENRFREVVGATGSEGRRKKIAEVVEWIVKNCAQAGATASYDVLVHVLSPDGDANIPESDLPDPSEVAWQKALVVAYALGLLTDGDIPTTLLESWREVIRFVAHPDEILEKGGLDVVVYGGDVVTEARPDELGHGLTELLKLERQLVGKTPEEQVLIIEADKKAIKEIFCHPDGFFVRFKASIALLSVIEDEGKRGLTAGWDMVVKFRALPEAMVEKAYEIGSDGEKIGSAYKVGPRLDLAGLAQAVDEDGESSYLDENFGFWVKNSEDDDEAYSPVGLKTIYDLVVGGLLKPHLCLELLLKLDTQPLNQQPLAPNKVKLQI